MATSGKSEGVHNGGARELSSWKEIAGYLGVGVRTAQMWERDRGLPVRRLPGEKGRAYALVEEIERWKAQPGLSNSRPAPKPRGPRPAIILAGVLLLGVLALTTGLVLGRREPEKYRFLEDAFVVLDSHGRELWRKPLDGIGPRSFSPHLNALRLAWVGDLDGDGHHEVLFTERTPQHPLVCFDRNGKERWRFFPNRTVRTSTDTFAPQYTINGFAVTAKRTIIVSSSHHDYPTQVALLAPSGAVVREYWHAGHLNVLALADLDGNGREEVILGGISNARHAATLVVLDEEHWGGASTEPERYQLLGFAKGAERARILFPRSCINRRYDAFNGVMALQYAGGELIVGVAERMSPVDAPVPVLDYHFGNDLSLKSVRASSTFEAEHGRLRAAGELDHDLSPTEQDRFRNLTYLVPPQAPAN